MEKNYNEKLMIYIMEYTKENSFPPTLDIMIENLGEIKSKSTLHHRLQDLVQQGLLIQKGKRGYYYPTSLVLPLDCTKKYVPIAVSDLLYLLDHSTLEENYKRKIRQICG